MKSLSLSVCFLTLACLLSSTFAWTWGPLPGVRAVGTPAVANIAPTLLEVFVRGTDRKVYHNWHNADRTWYGWVPLGDICTDHSPVVQNISPDRLIVFARECNTGNLLVNWMRPDRSWTGWKNKGGCIFFTATPVPSPAVAKLPDGNFEVFAMSCTPGDSYMKMVHTYSWNLDIDYWYPNWDVIGTTLITAPPAATTGNNGDIYVRAPYASGVFQAKRTASTQSWTWGTGSSSPPPASTTVPLFAFPTPGGNDAGFAYIGTDGNLWINGNNWDGSSNYITPAVAVTGASTGNFRPFTRTIGGVLQETRGPNSWTSISLNIAEGNGIGIGYLRFSATPALEIFAIDTSGAVNHVWE